MSVHIVFIISSLTWKARQAVRWSCSPLMCGMTVATICCELRLVMSEGVLKWTALVSPHVLMDSILNMHPHCS